MLKPAIWLTGLVGAAFVPAMIIAIRAAQEAWFDYSMSAEVTGFLLGAGLVSIPWALWTVALAVDGSASWRIGADAEQWTANELHRLGPSWRIEHNVPFPDNGYLHDVDHIAIGPYGVLAVETKWSTSAVDLGAKRLPKKVQEAIQSSEASAGRVRGLLRRIADIDVIPLVVYWGRDVTPPLDPVRREGSARIVAGKESARWRPLLDRQHLDDEMVARLSARVQSWLVGQEDKIIGGVVRHHLRRSRRLGLASSTATAVIVAVFPAAKAWALVDDLVGRVFRLGGGAVGVAVLVFPLGLTLAGLGVVHLARRLDPTISPTRGMAPLVVWCVSFAALVLLAE